MTAKTNQNAWIVKVTMLLYQEIAQNGKLRKTSWPSNTQKNFIRRCSQTFATLFRPIKGFICNCNTDPSSIFKTTSTLGQKNSESTLQSAASNDDENEIEMLTMSNKRTIHEDSSEEDTNSPLPAKKAATSSPASEQSGTHVPKGRGGGDLSKISTFPANAPQPRGRGSSQGDKSPARAPRFSNNTSEGSASSAQGGRNRAAINRQSLSKPPGTIKTATKDKTKLKGKNTNS